MKVETVDVCETIGAGIKHYFTDNFDEVFMVFIVFIVCVFCMCWPEVDVCGLDVCL